MLNKTGLSIRNTLTNIVLITNAFIWYFYAFNILVEILKSAELTYLGTLLVWVINFAGAAIFALAGAILTSKLDKRNPFLFIWMLFGLICSFIPLFLDMSSEINVLLVFFLFGSTFGLGMPAAMAFFSESTVTENRGRLGGIIFFSIGLGAFLLGILPVTELAAQLVFLATWRGLGLVCFYLIKPSEKSSKRRQIPSYLSVLRERSFLLYFIPWSMFCMVNQTSEPIIVNFLGADFVQISTAIEGALIGAFAIISGFVSDWIGRKRVVIAGFVMLGVGYAALGIYPQNLLSWYFYSVADGVAWGIFYAVFLIVLWGDLAHDAPSEKYYAVGALPYLLSNFLKFIIGSYLVKTVSVYTIFSLASFFLFLAVIPLLYASETLPEKKIKERELRLYVEKAKKIKEKHA